MRNTNFLLVATVAVATSIDRSAYDVISRPRHMRQQWGEDNKEEANISFDGSVAAIQALALEKADYLANNQPGFNRGVPTDLSSPITCDGTLTQSLLKVAFEYAVEYDPNYDPSQESRRQLTESDLNEIVQEIEKEMQVRMSNVLLTCKTDDPTVQEAAVVGLVDTPQDKTLTDKSCVPSDSKHLCVVNHGRMTFFLSDKQKEQLVKYLALLNIKEVIEDSTLVSDIGRGLVKITYISPDLISPYEAKNSSTISGASVAILSAGAGTVMVFLLIMLAWRRTFKKNALDLMLSVQQDSTSVYQAGGDSDEENGPSSPFSEMLPSAYRYSENMSILSGQGLSAVEEVTETDSSQRSINISLSGFSEDAPNDSGSPNLSAVRKRNEKGNSVNTNKMLDISRSVSESFSDVSESPSNGCDPDCQEATTQLLLGISSPTRANHEDDTLLFLP